MPEIAASPFASPSNASNAAAPGTAANERAAKVKSALVLGVAAIGLAAVTVGLVATFPASVPAVVALAFCAFTVGLMVLGDCTAKEGDQTVVPEAELNRRYERNYMMHDQQIDPFDLDDPNH